MFEYPRFFDPRKAGDPLCFTMFYMLFEGLTRLNADGTLEMAQAESVDISEDKKTYTFHLGNHRWSNGKPVTAQNYVETWRSMLDPKFPSISVHLLYSILNAREAKKGNVPLDQVGVRAIDDKTLEVVLEHPIPFFLQITSHCVLFPINHEVDKANPNWAISDGEQYVCNGPYALTKAELNQEIVVSKNPQYKGKYKAKLKKIVFCILPDAMSELYLFASGGVDLLSHPLTRFPLSYLTAMKDRQTFNANPVACNLFCGFNTTRYPFNNVHIRKAFGYAIDRKSIVDHISQLDEEVATHAVPSLLRKTKPPQFFEDANEELANHHLQLGLQELGIKLTDLKVITLITFQYEINQRVALALQEQWQKVLKVEVELKTVPFVHLLDIIRKEEHQVGVFNWLAEYYDPMTFFSRYASKDDPKNYARWEDPRFVELLHASNRAANSDERDHILLEMEQLFLDHMPIAPIFQWKYPYLVKPYVKGFTISPLGQIYFSEVSIDARSLP